jgi:hypothetical protein
MGAFVDFFVGTLSVFIRMGFLWKRESPLFCQVEALIMLNIRPFRRVASVPAQSHDRMVISSQYVIPWSIERIFSLCRTSRSIQCCGGEVNTERRPSEILK